MIALSFGFSIVPHFVGPVKRIKLILLLAKLTDAEPTEFKLCNL